MLCEDDENGLDSVFIPNIPSRRLRLHLQILKANAATSTQHHSKADSKTTCPPRLD